MPEIRDGIPAIFGMGLLWHLVGMSRTVYLVLTGDHLDARQALEAGLVAKLVPAAALRAEAEALARRLAAYAPLAIRADKAWARQLTETHFRATAAFCVRAQHDSFAAGDARRGMEAFLNRRGPRRPPLEPPSRRGRAARVPAKRVRPRSGTPKPRDQK
jgi:enoyl-CoA hydratase